MIGCVGSLDEHGFTIAAAVVTAVQISHSVVMFSPPGGEGRGPRGGYVTYLALQSALLRGLGLARRRENI